jgi:hypothetical protein
VKSVLWRQAEEFGVFYTEDREHLRRLLILDWFPMKREEDAATYKNPRGRVFAWQATFDLALWKRVVRALGREEIDIQLEEELRPRKRRAAVPPTTAPAPNTPASSPRAPAPARTPPSTIPPDPAPPRPQAAPASPVIATRPAKASAVSDHRSADLPVGEVTGRESTAAPRQRERGLQPAKHPAPLPSPTPDPPAAAAQPGKQKKTPTRAPSPLETGKIAAERPLAHRAQNQPSTSTPSAEMLLERQQRRAKTPAPMTKLEAAPVPSTGRPPLAAPKSPDKSLPRHRNGSAPPKEAETGPLPTTHPRAESTAKRAAPAAASTEVVSHDPKRKAARVGTPLKSLDLVSGHAGVRAPGPPAEAPPRTDAVGGRTRRPHSGNASIAASISPKPGSSLDTRQAPRSRNAAEASAPLPGPPVTKHPAPRGDSRGRAKSSTSPTAVARPSTSPAKHARGETAPAKQAISRPAGTDRVRAVRQEAQPTLALDLPNPTLPTRRTKSTTASEPALPAAVEWPNRPRAPKPRAGTSAPERGSKTARSRRTPATEAT